MLCELFAMLPLMYMVCDGTIPSQGFSLRKTTPKEEDEKDTSTASAGGGMLDGMAAALASALNARKQVGESCFATSPFHC